MVASKCSSHFLQFILLLLELFLAMKFDMSAGSVSTLSTANNMHKFCLYRYLGHGRFVGGVGGGLNENVQTTLLGRKSICFSPLIVQLLKKFH